MLGFLFFSLFLCNSRSAPLSSCIPCLITTVIWQPVVDRSRTSLTGSIQWQSDIIVTLLRIESAKQLHQPLPISIAYAFCWLFIAFLIGEHLQGWTSGSTEFGLCLIWHGVYTTACGHRMAHRKWKETKQQPGTAGPDNMLGCCLVSFHFLWAILCWQAVVSYHSIIVVQY